MSDEKYFPWVPFQQWLHEGIVAGRVLNMMIMETQPPDQKKSYPASIVKEQREFLKGVKQWAETAKKPKFCDAVNLVLQSDSGYPKLNDEQAQLLFDAINEYGTASNRFQQVLPALKQYLASFGDADDGLKKEFDAIWRSIGPSLSPDRTGLEEG